MDSVFRQPRPSAQTVLNDDDNEEGTAETYAHDESYPNNNKKKAEAAVTVHEVPTSSEPVNVSWDGPNDPQNPQNFPTSKKWNITAVCCVLTVNSTFASSAPSITVGRLIERFHISSEVSQLVTVLFLLGYVLGPIFWGSGSEIFGRRIMMMIALSAYTILFIGQALATNIQTVLVLRFISGTFAVAPLILCGGILADIWNAEGRGYATNLFGGCVFFGPVLGPLIGGFVAESHLGWEWIFWIMMILGGTVTVCSFLWLPETYAPILLTRKAQYLRKEDPISNGNVTSDHERQDSSFFGLVDRMLFRPWKMMAQEPILILVTLFMSLVYGLLYAIIEALPLIFATRGFTTSQQGLIFLSFGIGTTLSAFMGIYLAREVNKIIPKWKGFPPPELRLKSAMIGSVMLVFSTFWLGWTGNYTSIPWYVPAIATVFVGWSVAAVFISLVVYLIDTYLFLAATALASNTMIRSAVAAAFPLFTVQMFKNLGINWALTLIGLLFLLLTPIPFLFYKYGARIRERSKFAPCLDLKIAKQIREEEAIQALPSPSDGETASPEEAISDRHSRRSSVNTVLLENIQQLTNTMSEVQYLLNEAIASQSASSQSQRELNEAVHQLRDSLQYSRRDSLYGIGQAPVARLSGVHMQTIMEPLQAPAPTEYSTADEWSIRLGPIDLSAVTDLHGTALSFARMTKRGKQISPQVRGYRGGPHVLVMSWKTEEEARTFYEAWSEDPPVNYSTLSVVPSFNI